MSGGGESVKPYADRDLVIRQQWNSIIGDAVGELWLYGMAEFGYASGDAVPRILARATGRGCQARILLLNPGSQITEAIDRDEGHPPGTLATRITAALARLGRFGARAGRVSVVTMPVEQALSGIGSTITSMETVGALMAARVELQ